jgi:hypothetical protein
MKNKTKYLLVKTAVISISPQLKIDLQKNQKASRRHLDETDETLSGYNSCFTI